MALPLHPQSSSTLIFEKSGLALAKLWPFITGATNFRVAHVAEQLSGNFGSFNSHPTTEAWSYVYLFTREGMVPRPPITSLQSAGYVGPICPFKTSAVSLTACEILSLLKSVLKLPLTSIKRGFAS